jgi:acetoin utilization protein AcuB
MIAKDLINYMIPPLKASDDLDKARLWMDELRVNELPVADQGQFKGLVTEEQLLDADREYETIGELLLTGTNAFVHQDQHYYELLKMAYATGVRMVAVLDDQEHYTGVVSVEDVVEAFASASSVQTPGAILLLSMEPRDYALSEISKIIENNEAMVLSSHMLPHPSETGKVQVTIKTNREDIAHIAANLDARGYTVANTYSTNADSEEDQDRYEGLMRYLRI